MMNINNTYFENLKRIGHEYEAARVERQARKQQIIDTLGWDSEELKAWYAEDQAAKFPFEQGACKAYRAWANSISRREAELEMDDFLWDKEVADFIDALRSAGITSFVYTNQSTAVMENLHAFAAQGCSMTGLCTITRQETRWGDEEPVEIMGIRFSLN
jgi:phosphoglycolate phosphatase-like HAD superfamily hydrolase